MRAGYGILLAVLLASPAIAQDETATTDYALIREAIEGGRLVQARAMLGSRRLAEGNAVSTEFDIASAELALAEHRDAEALAAFADLDKRGIADCRAQAGLGTALMRQHYAADALPHLREAAEKCPENWRTWNALAIALDLARDWEGSAKAYETAFRLTGDRASVMNNYGFSLLLQRRFTEATRLFEAARKADPRNERYANNADIARTMAGQPLSSRDAEEPTERARRLNNAGYASLLAGRTDEAKAYFSRSLHASDSFNQRASANLSAITGE